MMPDGGEKICYYLRMITLVGTLLAYIYILFWSHDHDVSWSYGPFCKILIKIFYAAFASPTQFVYSLCITQRCQPAVLSYTSMGSDEAGNSEQSMDDQDESR